MRAFTIRESATLGLRLCSSIEEVRPQLVLGYGEEAKRIDVCGFHYQMFKQALEQEMIWRELGSDIVEVYKDNIDFAYDKRVLVQARQPRRNCLIHVETAAGVDGELIYLANTFTEYVNDNFVKRSYENKFPPAGVEIIDTGLGPQGEPQHLLLLLPGAQFRIKRTGELPEDMPDEFIVKWTGHQLCQELPPHERRRLKLDRYADQRFA